MRFLQEVFSNLGRLTLNTSYLWLLQSRPKTIIIVLLPTRKQVNTRIPMARVLTYWLLCTYIYGFPDTIPSNILKDRAENTRLVNIGQLAAWCRLLGMCGVGQPLHRPCVGSSSCVLGTKNNQYAWVACFRTHIVCLLPLTALHHAHLAYDPQRVLANALRDGNQVVGHEQLCDGDRFHAWLAICVASLPAGDRSKTCASMARARLTACSTHAVLPVPGPPVKQKCRASLL